MKSLITLAAIGALIATSTVSAAAPKPTKAMPEVDLSAFETLFNNAMKNPSTVKKPIKKIVKKPIVKKKIILKKKAK